MRKQRVRRPKLYAKLAPWFHLLTSPADYRHETACYARALKRVAKIPVRAVLELGSGGGNNALHLKARFQLTLSDISSDMLALSRAINPECEHVHGDMRTLRLHRKFDAVFVHDAIDYLTTPADLKAAMRTAFVHCRVGGAAIFCPDFYRETFKASTAHGGHDDEGRALRYLEWTYDPDPRDEQYVVDFAYLLREGNRCTAVHDRHIYGLFSRGQWLAAVREAGFTVVTISRPPGCSNMIVVRKDRVRPKR